MRYHKRVPLKRLKTNKNTISVLVDGGRSSHFNYGFKILPCVLLGPFTNAVNKSTPSPHTVNISLAGPFLSNPPRLLHEGWTEGKSRVSSDAGPDEQD